MPKDYRQILETKNNKQVAHVTTRAQELQYEFFKKQLEQKILENAEKNDAETAQQVADTVLGTQKTPQEIFAEALANVEERKQDKNMEIAERIAKNTHRTVYTASNISATEFRIDPFAISVPSGAGLINIQIAEAILKEGTAQDAVFVKKEDWKP